MKGTFVVLSAILVMRRFAILLKVKGEKRRFIHEAEDFVVFSPQPIKPYIEEGLWGFPTV